MQSCTSESRAPRVIIVQHVIHEGPGRLAPLLRERGVAVQLVTPDEPLPAPGSTQVDGVIVLGGPMGVHDTKAYPRLLDELRWLEHALARRLPVLGICLGSQLLATALGARVTTGPRIELGWHDVTLTPQAQDDALFDGQHRFPALHWHGDVFELPVGAVHLASSAQTVHQAFAWGPSAWGLLFHLEAGVPEVQAMARAFPADLSAAGTTADELMADTERNEARTAVVAALVFQRWVSRLMA